MLKRQIRQLRNEAEKSRLALAASNARNEQEGMGQLLLKVGNGGRKGKRVKAAVASKKRASDGVLESDSGNSDDEASNGDDSDDQLEMGNKKRRVQRVRKSPARASKVALQYDEASNGDDSDDQSSDDQLEKGNKKRRAEIVRKSPTKRTKDLRAISVKASKVVRATDDDASDDESTVPDFEIHDFRWKTNLKKEGYLVVKFQDEETTKNMSLKPLLRDYDEKVIKFMWDKYSGNKDAMKYLERQAKGQYSFMNTRSKCVEGFQSLFAYVYDKKWEDTSKRIRQQPPAWDKTVQLPKKAPIWTAPAKKNLLPATRITFKAIESVDAGLEGTRMNQKETSVTAVDKMAIDHQVDVSPDINPATIGNVVDPVPNMQRLGSPKNLLPAMSAVAGEAEFVDDAGSGGAKMVEELHAVEQVAESVDQEMEEMMGSFAESVDQEMEETTGLSNQNIVATTRDERACIEGNHDWSMEYSRGSWAKEGELLCGETCMGWSNGRLCGRTFVEKGWGKREKNYTEQEYHPSAQFPAWGCQKCKRFMCHPCRIYYDTNERMESPGRKSGVGNERRNRRVESSSGIGN
jgi:hypothetical protein